MAVTLLDVHSQFFDDAGDPLALGFVYTYDAVTDAPKAVYTDADGMTAHDNPIELDAAGRPPSPIYWTEGAAYSSVLKDADGTALDTVLSFTVPEQNTDAPSQYADVVFVYPGGPPATTAWIGGERFARAAQFPANFTGAYGFTHTNATASFVIDVQKNGSTCGTITVNTSGVYTFASAGGAVVNFAAGDRIDAYCPAVADATMADFGFTLAGTLA